MVTINQERAIEIAKEKLRAWREKEFKKNDLALQNALVDGTDTKALIERRDYLRNITSQCEGKSIEELKTLIIEIGAK